MKAKWIFRVLFVYLSVSNISFANTPNDEKEPKAMMTVSISGKLKLCSSEDKGYAFVDVRGGIPPYTITSKNKPTGQILENLSSGTYTVLIEDMDGNKLEERFVVQPPMPLIVEMEEIKHANQNPGDNGSAKINLKHVDDYSVRVEWSNGLKNVLEAENLEPGTYTVKVYDESGCDSTVHFEIKDQDSNSGYSFSTSQKNNSTGSLHSDETEKTEQGKTVKKRYSKEELRKMAEEIMASMDKD
ncbi:hypothetical protein [Algoriphagus sp. CAU 1675]|uniref:hypothetical protein n=1 Tax=Algoriphagus sp. CAU 1675 TaxID=3032597 RepID=UPI0023DB9BD8|nr:hypothetical protein [Algoriphagus sp. CAU 1675]MDF2158266.1 hypothetical protein [Algoriphagus sp. CAU 1675]